MSNLPVILLLVSVIVSCSSDKAVDPSEKYVGQLSGAEKWQLTQMSGNIANVPPTTGSNMAWQEWYLLYPDHSFTKIRVENNATTSEQGSFTLVTNSDGKYLQMSYASKNKLIANCTGETNELLRINSDVELTGTWSMCDGPGLLYQKVK